MNDLIAKLPQSVLVTGGAGFIGSHLVERLLREGRQVRVIDNLSNGYRRNLDFVEEIPGARERFEFVEGDIRDEALCMEVCQGMEGVLHQAALGSVPRSIGDPLTSVEVNARGMLNILEGARRCGVKRLVYASSSSVYGDDESLPKREAITGNALSPYAVSKVCDELYAATSAACYGLECVGLRYFNVFGPRQDPSGPYAAVIPLFIQALLRREAPIVHGDGTQSRDFTFVANVVEANLRALTAPLASPHRVFNIACGERINLLDLLNHINQLLSVEIEPRFVESRPGDVPHSLADIGRARQELGYEPHIALREGLRRTVVWFGAEQETTYGGRSIHS